MTEIKANPHHLPGTLQLLALRALQALPPKRRYSREVSTALASRIGREPVTIQTAATLGMLVEHGWARVVDVSMKKDRGRPLKLYETTEAGEALLAKVVAWMTEDWT